MINMETGIMNMSFRPGRMAAVMTGVASATLCLAVAAAADTIRNDDVARGDLPFFDVALTVASDDPVSFFFELTSDLDSIAIPSLPVPNAYPGPFSGISSFTLAARISSDDVGVSLNRVSPTGTTSPARVLYKITFDPGTGKCPIDGPGCLLILSRDTSSVIWTLGEETEAGFIDTIWFDNINTTDLVDFNVALKSAPVMPPQVPLPAGLALLGGGMALLGAMGLRRSATGRNGPRA